jgi:hypothetical protein
MPKRFWSRLCENTKISVSISTYLRPIIYPGD